MSCNHQATRLPILAGLLALAAAAAPAQTLFVDAQAGAGGDGSTWAKAFTKLELALQKAQPGHQVWVAHGTYTGGFVVPAGVSIYGGFESGANRLTQRDPRAFPTILDGATTQRVLRLGDQTLVDGFTVTRGNAGDDGGGGALVKGVRATIRGCLFLANRNSAGRASALHVLDGGDCRLEGCVFTKNNGSGHVVDFTTAKGTVSHIVIWDNFSNGLHFHLGSAVGIYNSIFGRNTGRGLCHISDNDAPVLENNLIWSNNVSLYHYRGTELRSIDAVNALPYAKNNLSGDPLFVDAANDDWRVATTSPVLERGRPMLPFAASSTDYYGNSRLLDSDLDGTMLADIGVAEHAAARLLVAGQPVPNGKLMLEVKASPGVLGAALAIGGGPAALLVAPWGYLGIDPASGLAVLPWPVNNTLSLPVPTSVLPGTAFVFQALALAAGAANLTNAADVRIR